VYFYSTNPGGRLKQKDHIMNKTIINTNVIIVNRELKSK